MTTTTYLRDPATGDVLRRSWSVSGELIASDCRVCREHVPKARLVGTRGKRRRWL